jgi:ABC-type polysaccharide/polyol phosphate transport system ATPase subunit
MSAPPQAVVTVEDVSKRFRMPREKKHTLKERVLHPRASNEYHTLDALKPLSFRVEPGEFFGIVGRNGSGKSTLLKCLAGIYRADSGAIHMDGRVSTFIELGVGFNPDLAAKDNVILNGIMLGLSRAEARQRYEDVIQFAELEEFENLKLKNYSSGMHVRLAFSVMIQVDADILLIDEVLAVGDASFQQKCFDEFNRLRDADKTILFVTHDMGAVVNFCDRAMLLERGEVLMIDKPRRVADQYLDLNFRREEDAPVIPEIGDEERIGDGKATIEDIWVEDDTYQRRGSVHQGEACSIKTIVHFNEPIENPAFSFAVEDGQHRPVFATSTSWEQEMTGSFAAGDRIVVVASFENMLAPGRYYITPQVAHRGSGVALIDRREAMMSVMVTGSRQTGGLVDIPHDLRLESLPADIPTATGG